MGSMGSQYGMMPFYHSDGFESSYRLASLYAGANGRIATLPDIIDARLGASIEDVSWTQYFTTMSAEYVGLDARGRPIAVVAHGIGPMSTMAGAVKANTHKPEDRHGLGGRISRSDFLKLAAGEFGEVSVISLTDVWDRRQYSFSGHAVTAREIENESLWQARLGPRWKQYVDRHTEEARRWHAKTAGVPPENRYGLPDHDQYCDRIRRMHLDCATEGKKQPCILTMDGANNCPYSDERLFRSVLGRVKDTAIGHLLAIGQLVHSHHEYYVSNYEEREQRTSLASDVDCHEWSNGVRLVGVRADGPMRMGRGMPLFSSLVKDSLDDIMVSYAAPPSVDFWHLVSLGGHVFTDVPKSGDGMDRCVPEFHVTAVRELGKGQFRTTIGGYHGFLKYSVDEVKRVAPPEANAYVVEDFEIECTDGNPSHHLVSVTFFAATVDASRRVLRQSEIDANDELVMKLLEQSR